MKTCSKCGGIKSVDDFYPRMGRCKKCHVDATRKWAVLHPEQVAEAKRKFLDDPTNRVKGNIAAKRWYQNNTERAKATRFEYELRVRYDLTLLQYNQMAARQDFRCALCESDEQELVVDHNHDTAKVRGLLCDNCNRGIGLLKENAAVLNRAANYISI